MRRKKVIEQEEVQTVTDDLDYVPVQNDEVESEERAARPVADSHGSRLSWLVDDFNDQTTSVYEAVMVAAHRARQIGRRQKLEIDTFNSSQVLTPESIEQEETAEKGIDRFQHPKPTIKALGELKERGFEFYYLDEDSKKEE